MSLTELQLFAEVFEAVDAGLIVVAADERVVGWNAWIQVTSGVPGDLARGRRLEEIFPGRLSRRLTASVADVLQSGVSAVLTPSLNPVLFPLKTPSGRELIHSVAIRPIGDALPLVLIQITDVTTTTERDKALRQRQNARYDAVVESAPDAILTLDAEGMIQMANTAAVRAFGYPLAEMIHRPITALLRDPAPWAATFSELLRDTLMTRPVQVVAQRRDGSSSFIEVSASRWRSDGRIFVTVILRDVSERRAAEDALRRVNQLLEERVTERTADRDRIWQLSNDVMLVARLDGTISSTNPAWQRLLGWTPADLINARLSDFVVEDDRASLNSAFTNMAHGGGPYLFELRLRDRNGLGRRIAWSAVVAGERLHAVGRDVTAELEAREALARAEETLRQAQKMEALGQLTGGIAHDFNNLLTGILGAMHILKRRIAAGRTDDVERFMDAAVESANRAAALTHRLLAFARRQPLDPQSLDVNRLIEGMEDLLRRTLGEQVKLEIKLSDELQLVVADANQLENALLNLAINSRDAMPQGGRLTIETAKATDLDIERQEPDEIEPGDYMMIRVDDTGVGMTPETLAKAFEPFFTTKPTGQGTGLGLSMIYGFVKQSHGFVRIESKPGHGTAVMLFLPSHAGSPASRPPSTVYRETPKGTGETVLLVEDDASVRMLISEILRELGYASLEAADGRAAIPMLASDARLDLMITDVGLPGLNGRQLAEIAREHRPHLKILFVTAYAERATERQAFLAPGMEMVTKPFVPEMLALKIRDMIASDPS